MRFLVLVGAIAASSISIAGAARSARAQGVGQSIGVIAATAEPNARTPVGAAIAEAMHASGARRVVADAVTEARTAYVEGAVPVATLARFRRVREEIDEGWRAYTTVQLDVAASRLAVARTDAETLLALPGASVLYADASLRLGAVLAQLGRSVESQSAIALALALDPDRPITEREFSPDVIAAVAAARAQPRQPHAVHVTSDPGGAAIGVDGRDAGRTPATVELAPGEHVLVARAPGYEPRGQAVAVEAATAQLALALDRDEQVAAVARGAAFGLPDPGAQSLTDAVLELADLDEVALVAQTDRRGGPTLLVQRCAGAPARCTAVVEIGYADASGLLAAARAAWIAVQSAELRYPPSVFGDARVTDRHVAERCAGCRSPYLWGGIGAAVVAGAIAIIAVATASKPPPILTVSPPVFTH